MKKQLKPSIAADDFSHIYDSHETFVPFWLRRNNCYGKITTKVKLDSTFAAIFSNLGEEKMILPKKSYRKSMISVKLPLQ